MDNSEVITAFLHGFGQWKGCAWPTAFGGRNLDLDGLKSSQAALIARSTAGEERASWTAAAQWLTQVEQDARRAESEAELAAELAILGQLDLALEYAEHAHQLESRYKSSGLVWQRLRNVIRKQVNESARVDGHDGHGSVERWSTAVSRDGARCPTKRGCAGPAE